jgi:transposase
LLFLDAVHFVHCSYLGSVWSKTRAYLPSPSGRQRRNILGAYNATTGQITTLANDSYITASTVRDMLCKLSQQYAGRPITIILDNARYQRCRLVTELAQELNITLCFLPPYSPNLNLIERLWRLVKNKCLYNKYYRTFTEFKTAIDDCLAKLETDYKNDVMSMMTLNFQTFEKDNVLAL